MANKNNSPEQKAAWEANKNLGSRFIRMIRPSNYDRYRSDRRNLRVFDDSGRRLR